MTNEIKRGLQVLREDGPLSLAHRAREYAARYELTRNGIEKSYQTGTRVDFEERVDLILSQLDSQDTLLDIGCAEGDFTATFARGGMVTIGIERQNHVVTNARRRHRGIPNVGFIEFEVTPESIGRLPDADVVLLLAVYHHWNREFDGESQQMLQVLVNSSEKVFFEIPDNDMDDEWKDVGDVTFLGRTEYKGGDRDDLLFLIE